MGFSKPFQGSKKIVVTFERREDGGLRVFSEALPGFVLSSTDAHAALKDVLPALEFMLTEKYGVNIKVEPLADMATELVGAGIIDPMPQAKRESREYVARLEAA